MKLEIPTREIASSLPLWSVESYLKSRGWSHQGFWGPNATIHAVEQGGQNYEVLVPLRDTLSDYADVMERLISMLAEVETRSEFDVFVDLANTGSDVVRLASTNGFGPSAMSLSASSDLYRGARDLLANAARSAEQPRASYAGRFSGDVVEYLDTVIPVVNHQSGHSLTLQSPVPPSLSQRNGIEADNDESFARKTVSTLATALQHTDALIEQMYFEKSTPSGYDEAISAGVSANLCENIASLARTGHGIEIGIHWASTRPASPLKHPFRFTQHSVEMLQEVSKDIRRKRPSYDERITAQVLQLERTATSI